MPPPARAWRNVVTEPELVSMHQNPHVETFKVLCYNVLSDKCATERAYGYTASWALTWKYRRDLIIRTAPSLYIPTRSAFMHARRRIDRDNAWY